MMVSPPHDNTVNASKVAKNRDSPSAVSVDHMENQEGATTKIQDTYMDDKGPPLEYTTGNVKRLTK